MYAAQKPYRSARSMGRAWFGGLAYRHARDDGIPSEEDFIKMLSLERKRTERSRKQFVLMLLHAEPLLGHSDQRAEVLKKILSALFSSVRETDARGWYRNDAVIGVIFTEISETDLTSVLDAIFGK